MAKTRMLHILVDDEDFDRILSKCKNTSISAYVRNLIKQDLIGSYQNINIENDRILSNKENDRILSNTDPSDVWEKLSI
jgi:hypothetical protein